MSKWQKEYPIDFSPFGDTQGSAVNKQDQEFDVIYEKLNKVLKHRYDDYSTATDLERGEIITKSGYKVTVNESGKQVIINILKNGSVENDSNDSLNNLGYKKIGGRIPVLDFRSDILGGYITIAKVGSSPEPYTTVSPDADRRGGIAVTLSAAKLLPSDLLPLSRKAVNVANGYSLLFPYRCIEEQESGVNSIYRPANGIYIYKIRYHFCLDKDETFYFYIQQYHNDLSVYYNRNIWHNDGTLYTSKSHSGVIPVETGNFHSGEMVYCADNNIRTMVCINIANDSGKYGVSLTGGRWRNTGSNVANYLGYSNWHTASVVEGKIIIERVY